MIFGKTHSSTLSMYSKIAPTYEVQEDYDSARKLYHRVYEGRRVLLGAGPAATIRSGAELVAATKRLDLLEKTKALGIWPAANCKSSDDLGHDARMNLLRTIALAMQGRGGYSVAGDLYRTLLFVKVKVRGLKPSRHADRGQPSQNPVYDHARIRRRRALAQGCPERPREDSGRKPRRDAVQYE